MRALKVALRFVESWYRTVPAPMMDTRLSEKSCVMNIRSSTLHKWNPNCYCLMAVETLLGYQTPRGRSGHHFGVVIR